MARKGPQQPGMTYVVGFLAAFVMPAFVTAIAPVSWVTLTHDAGRVSARVRTCLFFIVPYRSFEISPLTEVDDQYRAGGYERDAGGREVEIEAEAFLVLRGPQGEAGVPVSPINVDGVVRETREYLADPRTPSKLLVTVANWKFSVLAGVPLTLLAGLYLVGVLLSVWRLLRRSWSRR